MSEKTRGSSGILPKIPHFWLLASSPALAAAPLNVDRLLGLDSGLAALPGYGISKTCSVDLSEVTARSFPEGDIAREKIVAWSTPRLSSAMRAQLLVAKTRIKVPYFETIRAAISHMVPQHSPRH